MQTKALYIHIPFCDQICSYCVFNKTLKIEKFVDEYMESLVNEIESCRFNFNSIKTIYIGGGTPSSLTINELTLLFECLKNKVDLNKIKEFTFEANPNDLSLELAKFLKSNFVNRISIGVQSFDDDILQFYNRTHRKEDIYQAVQNLKQVGITNINIDLIYGLKKQSLKQIINDIELATQLDIKHISYYALELYENSKLYLDKIDVLCDDDYAEYYKFICEKLKNYGFENYEISNFAKNEKFQSLHNKTYWNFENYFAFGLGASAFIDDRFIEVTKNLSKYNKKEYSYQEEKLSKKDIIEIYIMENLRLRQGIKLNGFSQRFGMKLLEVLDVNNPKISPYIEVDYKFLKIKDEFRYVMNDIVTEIFLLLEGV